MGPLQTQLDRIRRRRGLVLVIMALTVIGTVAFSLLQGASYTGKSALTVSSPERAPDQDAALARGYVEYFNQDSSKQVLRAKTQVPATVDFSARTSATSPIVYIEATAPNSDLAAASAKKLAETFRDDINGSVRQTSDAAVANLRTQITDAENRLKATAVASVAERASINEEIRALQDRVAALQSDTTNQLKDLQLNAGVASTPTNIVQNAVLALVGGLILGVVAALALASAENRLSNPQDVRDRLGTETLAMIQGSNATEGQRAQQLKGLANVVSLSDMSRPATLAVIAPRDTAVAAQVAEGIAYYRAQQGERTLLIRADLDPDRRHTDHSDRPGLGDFLAGRPGIRLQPIVVPGGPGGMLVVPPGGSRSDPYALFAPERVVDLVQQAGRLADLVVIDAPPIVEAAEGQVICASADRTILVVEQGATRASDAVEALQRLEQVHSRLLGVVICGASSEPVAGSFDSRPPPPAARAGAPNGVAGSADEVEVRA